MNLYSLELSGSRIAYIDEGAGTPVLLLHGAPVTALGFVRVIRELRKHYRVIAPDLPGFGGSELPLGHSGRLSQYAQFVEDFCRALALRRFYLFVNDASASFGIAAAARLADELRGLVVADTVPFPLTGAAWPIRQVLRHVVSSRPVRWLNRRLNMFAWLVATVAPWLRPFPRQERRMLTSQFDTAAKRERIIDLFAQMGWDDDFMRHTVALARLHLTKLRTLIMFGQFDPMRWVGGAERFRRMFPNSRLCIVPWEEHFPILSSGTQVARLIHHWMAEP